MSTVPKDSVERRFFLHRLPKGTVDTNSTTRLRQTFSQLDLSLEVRQSSTNSERMWSDLSVSVCKQIVHSKTIKTIQGYTFPEQSKLFHHETEVLCGLILGGLVKLIKVYFY